MTRPPRTPAACLALAIALAAACGGRGDRATVADPVPPRWAESAPGPAAELGRAAEGWLASLDGAQRRRALYDFGDAERFDLRLAPLLLEGLRGDRMSDAQWEGARSLLAAVLSQEGLEKVETIMSLEPEVRWRDVERGGLRWPMQFLRDPRRYYLALFGPPRPDAPWGLRFDGHHLSLNWTALPDGALSVTPLFLGAEPRELPFGSVRAELRVLAEEEDRARVLFRSLDPEQRRRASLPLVLASGPLGARRALFLGEGPRIAPRAPVGIPRRELGPEQARSLDALIDVYLANFRTEVAAARRRAIDAAGRDAIHFAWAGDAAPDQPLYYRIQGPGFLIEFDDTVPEADHVHAIYREFEGDFGRDLLRAHHVRAHAAP